MSIAAMKTIEEAVREVSALPPKSPHLRELSEIYRQASEETGFPRTMHHEGQFKDVLVHIGTSLFFQDLRELHNASLTPEQKSAAILQSIRLMRQCADNPVKTVAQETFDDCVKRFYESGGYAQNAEAIRARYAESCRPLECEAPQALANVHAGAIADFNATVNELLEAERFEAQGGEPDDGLPPFPEKSELRYDAATALATAAATERIARIFQQTRR